MQDEKLMLQRIGMFGDANDGGGRGRTHSRDPGARPEVLALAPTEV